MNILYLTHRVPYPLDKGDRIRNGHMLRFLASQGNVWLGCLADEPVPASTTTHLQTLTHQLAIVPCQPKLRYWHSLVSYATGGSLSAGMFASSELKGQVRQWAAQTRFDVAMVSSSALGPYLAIPELRGVTKLVDLVDVDSQKWLDYAATESGPKKWLYRSEGQRVARLEQQLAEQTDGLILVSEVETKLLRQRLPEQLTEKVITATNGVDLDYFQPLPVAASVSPSLAFVGAFDYKPNVDGALWFIDAIWPGIRQQNPECRLKLVGRNPVPALKAWHNRDNIEVTGSVPDVRPHVAEAAIVIAPLRIARGLQNKVLEALAMGKPVVATPNALQGFTHGAEVPALAVETPAQWVDTISQLLRDGDHQQELGLAGRQFAEQYHAWDVCLNPIRAGMTEELCPIN